jgi:hypothetical protein
MMYGYQGILKVDECSEIHSIRTDDGSVVAPPPQFPHALVVKSTIAEAYDVTLARLAKFGRNQVHKRIRRRMMG